MKKLFSIVLVFMIAVIAVVPAFAASDSFVPSIEAKDNPTLISQVDSKGNQVGGIIYDSNGNEVVGIPEDAIIITSYANADSASDEIKQALESAYDRIIKTGNMGSLVGNLQDYMSKNYPDIDIDDLLVSQLFDIRLKDEYSKYLVNGAYLEVKLDLSESFLFLIMAQENNWILGKDYRIEGNNLILRLTGSTQIATIKAKTSSNVPADKNNADVVSPKTGDNTNPIFVILGGAFAVFAVVFIAAYAKNKSNTRHS